MADKKINPRFANLLRQAREEWGVGCQKKIAAVVGVSGQTVTNWKHGESEPSKLEMDAISEALGNGAKYPKPSTRGILVDDGPRVDAKRPGASVLEVLQRITAPIISFAQGGEGAYPEDLGNNVPRIPVFCKDPNCYVLELVGDSMEPIYRAGDLLVIAPNEEPLNNDLVVVRTVDDEVLFKQLRHPKKDSEQFQFISLNPNHPPRYLRGDEIFKISVVDTVIKPIKRKVRSMTVEPLSKMR